MLASIKIPYVIDARIYFAEVLSFIYQIIIATESLLDEAIEKTDGAIKEYLISHRKEETDHAAWMKEDLKELGIDADFIPENEIAAEMVGKQYYYLKHGNPLRFFGYMLYLEAFPAHPSLINQLELLYGEKAVRTLKYHAEHDVDHSKELISVIDSFSDEDKEIVYDEAQKTANAYSSAMKKIVQDKKLVWQMTA